MLIGDVRPTTLDGVKSLAAQLHKEQGIKHGHCARPCGSGSELLEFQECQTLASPAQCEGCAPLRVVERLLAR